MNKTVIYIVGATVLVGGAYLFLKNKKEKDLSKLAELGGTTPSGTTSGGATSSLSNTSDGVSPSDASINLANASALVPRRRKLYSYVVKGFKWFNDDLVKIDKELSDLGYKVDNKTGLLIKLGENTSDANLNLANANLIAKEIKPFLGIGNNSMFQTQLQNLQKKLADLGYKVDAKGQLVKI
jgi:hypothetical protein